MRVLDTARAALAVLGILVLSGCHTWVPVEDPAPGSTVRVRLPPPDASEDERTFSGRLMETGDTLLIVGNLDRRLATYPELVRPDSLQVARNRVLALEEETFSTPRTLGFTALAMAGGALLIAGIQSIIEGNTDDDEGGGEIPPPMDVPLAPFLRVLFGG